jgi:hypothetical protein
LSARFSPEEKKKRKKKTDLVQQLVFYSNCSSSCLVCFPKRKRTQKRHTWLQLVFSSNCSSSCLFAEREKKLMHVSSAFENKEIPLHCHEAKIPHSSILKLFLCSSPSSSSSSSHRQEESRKKERCVQLSVGFTSVEKYRSRAQQLAFGV